MWKWPDGTGPAYVNWQTGEPGLRHVMGRDERNAMINCYADGLCASADGKWYDAPTTGMDRSPSAARTTAQAAGAFLRSQAPTGSGTTVQSECAAIGGTFTCIDDEAQNIQALAAFRGHCPGGADDCGAWIAVSDEASEGNWVCTADGSPANLSALVRHRQTNQMAAPRENCVNMWGPNSGRNDGAWNDYGCTVLACRASARAGTPARAPPLLPTTAGRHLPLCVVRPSLVAPMPRHRCRLDTARTTRETAARRAPSRAGAAWLGYEVRIGPLRRVGLGTLREHLRPAERVPVLLRGGWLLVAEDLFVAGPNGGNYYDAAAYCSSIGAEIATIYSSTENELARQACGGSSCWIGLSEQGGTVEHGPRQSGVDLAGRQRRVVF